MMQPILTFTLTFLTSSILSFGNLLHNEIEDIVILINNGDSKGLSTFFDKHIEIGINKEQELYSNTNAILIIESFFKEYPPKRFEIIHKSKIDDNSSNIIGTYYTENGKIFRTSFYVYSKNDKFLIQEIHFNESNDEPTH